jgi:uncharacterized DUF497 family protein
MAPYGAGVYELLNRKTGQYVLRGMGANCAHRMSSILPRPHGQGTHNNSAKRQYVLVRRAAELDIAQAQIWYEAQQAGLAAQFHSEITATMGILSVSHPERSSRIRIIGARPAEPRERRDYETGT